CLKLLPRLLRAMVAVWAFLPVLAWNNRAMATPKLVAPQAKWGEYGANFRLLQEFASGPENVRESNWFIDMQTGPGLRRFAAAHGLTNNHALFVLSHGRAIQTPSGFRYAFYSATTGEELPTACFSVQDLASLLGG